MYKGINYSKNEHLSVLIEAAYDLGYNPEKAIREYTKLEIEYAPRINDITPEIQEKAFKQIQDKMLRRYIDENRQAEKTR